MKTPVKRLIAATFIAFLPAGRAAAEDGGRTFHIPCLYLVSFWVRDIEKSRAFYESYLGFDEPYDLPLPNGGLELAALKMNERQVIYVFPNPAKIRPDGENLHHVGLEVDDVAALHDYLAARGLAVKPLKKGRIGDLILNVTDPDGHLCEISEHEPEGQLMLHHGHGLAATRISSHLKSAAISVADLNASLRFYRDRLGFNEVWRDKPVNPSSVHLQVPDGADYLDLQPYAKEPGADAARAVPEYSLAVPDAAKAAEILAQRAQAGGFSSPAPLSVGVDGRRRTSCVDPDGTRVVLEEFPDSGN